MEHSREPRLRYCLLLFCLTLLTACASKPPPEPPVDDAEALLELMEFLLEFETEEGEWIDPEQIQE